MPALGSYGAHAQSFYQDPFRREVLQAECFNTEGFAPECLAKDGFYLKENGLIGCCGCPYEVKEQCWKKYPSLAKPSQGEKRSLLYHEHNAYHHFAETVCEFKRSTNIENSIFTFHEFIPGRTVNVTKTLLAEYKPITVGIYCTECSDRIVIPDFENTFFHGTGWLFSLIDLTSCVNSLTTTAATAASAAVAADAGAAMKGIKHRISHEKEIKKAVAFYNRKIDLLKAIEPHMESVFLKGEKYRVVQEGYLHKDCDEGYPEDCKRELVKAFSELIHAIEQHSDNKGISVLISPTDNESETASGFHSGVMDEPKRDALKEVTVFFETFSKYVTEYAALLKDEDIFADISSKVLMLPTEEELEEQSSRQPS